MKAQTESQKNLIEYYESARESFVTKMKSEDDERSNLKFKIAAFVIHELSCATPVWFKNHFLTYIAKNDTDRDCVDEKVIKVETAFYNVVAEYLLKMEADVEYVRKILAPFTQEQEKKKIWEPIVFDAFLIVGIYFTPSLSMSGPSGEKVLEKQAKRKIHPRYLDNNYSDYSRNMQSRMSKNRMAQGMNS